MTEYFAENSTNSDVPLAPSPRLTRGPGPHGRPVVGALDPALRDTGLRPVPQDEGVGNRDKNKALMLRDLRSKSSRSTRAFDILHPLMLSLSRPSIGRLQQLLRMRPGYI